jgi:hypothetical protein
MEINLTDRSYKRLVKLLIKTAKAHHAAFEEVNGDHPQWAYWYAERMQDGFEEIMDRSVSVDGLADLLKRFDELHAQENPGELWVNFYARKLLDFYSD